MMAAQPVLSNGICREFVFPISSTVTTRSVTSVHAGGGVVSGGQMPLFQSQGPAVIRLSHSRPNSKPCSSYSHITNKYLVNENEETLTNGCLFTELEIAKDTVINNEKNRSMGVNNHIPDLINTKLIINENSRTSMTENERENSHQALISSLLKSSSNIRPISRQPSHISSAAGEIESNSQGSKTPSAISSYSKPCTRNSSAVSRPSTEHNTQDGCNTDFKDSNSGAIEENEKPLQRRSVDIGGFSGKSSKKAKRAKKRSKSQSSSYIAKPYIITNNNKVLKISKMKIPVATKTKPTNEIKKETHITIENNLLQVEAHGKPILVSKQEKHVFARLTSNTEKIVKNRDNMNTIRCNTANGSRSENVEKPEKPKSAGVSLPQMTKSNCIVKTDPPAVTASCSVDGSTTNRSFIFPNNKLNLHHANEIARLTKIYLSEKHSINIKDCGMEFPSAPPATPTPDQLKKYEYIPSMKDIRAQRAVKLKLQVLEKEAQKRSVKQREDKAKMDKQLIKEREKDMKLRQRREIYALNSVMTELEHQRFMEFCNKKGLNTG